MAFILKSQSMPGVSGIVPVGVSKPRQLLGNKRSRKAFIQEMVTEWGTLDR